MKALVTGSGGLIGSACVRLLIQEHWAVVGIDNNMRELFFGADASIAKTIDSLRELRGYEHYSLDIRDREAVRALIDKHRPNFVIHTAAQPSHDRAAAMPYEDFDINATGTLNLLVAARDICPDSPFCFTSTNKVYGDHPNRIPLIEYETRFDYADGRDGVDESMSVDQCLHSLFGASKIAADVLCQEFGRYYGMPVGVFRGSCLTGSQHAAVDLHGFLAYIVRCAVMGKKYTVLGYGGKQVRDQIHCSDVAELFLHFYSRPRCGEVYNLGGGRANSISILETVDILKKMGFALDYNYLPEPRLGDHICYISDLRKLREHYPQWTIKYDLTKIFDEIAKRYHHSR
jgi:CDP-paratose 2-epimerase